VNRALLVALPFCTVLVVAFALLVVGAPRAVYSAEIYGGPTEGAGVLAWRVVALEDVHDALAPARFSQLRVRAELRDGRRFDWSGPTDARGMANVLFELGGRPTAGAVRVEVTTPSVRAPLASGSVELSRARWFKAARFRGGFIEGKQTGALRVRGGPRRGAFALPFRDPLWVDVRGASGPVEGARLALSGESVDVLTQGALVTDANGRAVVVLEPRDFYVALEIRATAPDGAQGSWYSTLPVVTGALHAVRDGDKLVVESPIVRRRAYYALLDDHEQLRSGPLLLVPDAQGGARGSLALGMLPNGPLWAMVSNEPDLASESTVGWPLASREASPLDDAPPRSLVVPDQLLLDGLPAARARDAARRGRARVLAGAFSLGALLLVALLLVVEVRASSARLALHLTAAGETPEDVERVAARRGLSWTLAVAVLCVALGFIAVALVAMYKLG
jgi:hypothetical protein